MKRLLYLPVETIARELDAKLLLAHRALSRGYVVITGQKSNVFKSAERLRYGIYLYKSHGIKGFPCSQNKNETDFIYTALDEEGFVFLDDKSYMGRAKPHKLKHLDMVFTCGSYQRNLLLRKNPGLKSKTISVGNPRFDILRPEFSSLYSKVRERLYKTWGKYILINTSFSAGNFSRHYGRSYTEYKEHTFVENRGRSLTESEYNHFLKKEEYNRDLFNLYKELLQKASLKFPDLNFIVRPHPSEDHENWRRSLRGLKNVHVIFKGSAVDWIIGAIAVIHAGCTTGIESWALRKMVIVYNPKTETGIEAELPRKFGLKTGNMNEVIKILESIIAGRFYSTFNEQVETAYPFIENIKGRISVERIMDAIDDLVNVRKFNNKDSEDNIYIKLRNLESVRRAWKFRILKWIVKHRPAIRKLAGKRVYDCIFNPFKKYPGLLNQFQKFPGLGPDCINDKLLIFDSIFQKKGSRNYSIRKIATDTYVINKR